MRIEITEALWLDEHHEFSLTEFVALSGLSVNELQHLVDCEALSPAPAEPAADTRAAEARFSADCLSLARAASRLRNDFDLDANGLTLTLRLLNRIHELEAELHDLRAQLPRSMQSPR
jgi:chaperone modulatory protein CbpM